MDNKIYEIKVKLDDSFKNEFHVDSDYMTYYINFVTDEQYCYLHDGTYANPNDINKNSYADGNVSSEHYMELCSLMLLVINQYGDKMIEGTEYGMKNNIPKVAWRRQLNEDAIDKLDRYRLEHMKQQFDDDSTEFIDYTMIQIENKIYEIKVKLDENFKKDFHVDSDYMTYYINFVTSEQYCYLHDGTYADPYHFNRKEYDEGNVSKEHFMEFAALMLLVVSQYSNMGMAGDRYARKHNILRADWCRRSEEEENMRQEKLRLEWEKKQAAKIDDTDNESMSTDVDNANNETGTYFIIPSASDRETDVMTNASINTSFNRRDGWTRIDKGYTHDSMMTEKRYTWLYGTEENPKAIITFGVMKEKILIKVRFIVIDGEIINPYDLDFEMPYEPVYDKNGEINRVECYFLISDKIGELIDNIVNTCEKDE